ncbi:type IV pilus twitching motility protein PilT [Novipirellula artificiosorum]|uniref:Twitching mobility protein n=1 Tax=Novipirellula artificiosorum TaxID=2528016 RepID=A0A5C6D8U5_9BACT|nr:type IV pilus twitching motility protein PilT [Novipirellula artificiosorum]TWU33362.1 Twitching mobility protein [Novipirellula artificiosorum]
MAYLDPLLLRMKEVNASDLHLVVGQPPKYRIDGQIQIIKDHDVLSRERLAEYMFELCSEGQRSRYEQNLDFDFAYGIGDEARFRCNYFFQRTGYGAVMRLIPTRISTVEELGLPPVLLRLTELRSGLVLVTGPTGSGKSTTLAAMIDHINQQQRKHIVTIEDPIEFVHANRQSIITHREVGEHTPSFASALRTVTRQDADVVLVGEMRDLETISQAISAASMGTLVFGTLHTNSAPKTIDRIIDVFPSDQQAQIRTMLAESIRGIVAQQLLLRKGGQGRVAANEVLFGTSAVANIIREGKIEKITSVLQSGRREGMLLMDDSLQRLVDEKTIDGADAYMKASEKQRFAEFAPE